jgi:hypothetical protein
MSHRGRWFLATETCKFALLCRRKYARLEALPAKWHAAFARDKTYSRISRGRALGPLSQGAAQPPYPERPVYIAAEDENRSCQVQLPFPGRGTRVLRRALEAGGAAAYLHEEAIHRST